jgi:DNA-binding transcriptional MerR regulator
MNTKLKEVIERLETWPEERQEDAARVLLEMEAQDTSSYQLTDEQLAELRRRRAEKTPKILTLAEFDQRLRRFGI